MKTLNLGSWRGLNDSRGGSVLRLPARHLTTHGVVLGMTGSGKTGLLTVLIEEALQCQVPVIMIDVKGDLPNLLLSIPSFAPDAVAPWIECPSAPVAAARLAAQVAGQRREALESWSIDCPRLEHYASSVAMRVLTPGSSAGERMHVLSSLEHRARWWDTDTELARLSLSAGVSLVLRLIGRDPDPAKSREHVLLSVLAERRLLAGQTADLPALMQDLLEPPIADIGTLPMDKFMRPQDRHKLAAALNALLASPTFASWRQGARIDIAQWLAPQNGRTPAVIVSVAHLSDDERALVLGVLLQEILCWVRTLNGSSDLRALVVFDEVYGFLPPHPANPPTKRPLVALMKQARGFGVGVVVATQNPMDLDYRALSNAGLWWLGRLTTDADRERVLDGLALAGDGPLSEQQVGTTLQRLKPRWFVVKNAHASCGPVLMQPRHAMTLMRGPMTRSEIKRARQWRAKLEGLPEVDEKQAPQPIEKEHEQAANTKDVAQTLVQPPRRHDAKRDGWGGCYDGSVEETAKAP